MPVTKRNEKGGAAVCESAAVGWCCWRLFRLQSEVAAACAPLSYPTGLELLLGCGSTAVTSSPAAAVIEDGDRAVTGCGGGEELEGDED